MKIKNILIIGLGSIAKKHLKILKKTNQNIRIFKLKNKNKNKSLNYINRLIINYKLKSALICSPADTHLNYINFLKKKKINYLIKKTLIKNNKIK